MSELNISYTYNYKQPKDYHFSLDSIHLARFVASQLQFHPSLNSLRVLDLCAGCGVIGMELSWHLPDLKQIDFIEVQEVYTEYFYHNKTNINRPELQFNWHLLNYDVLQGKEWEASFDLIISNPPYFRLGHGMLSPSKFKNRCRFFLDSTFENYIRGLENSLAHQGKAYFLLHPLKQHGLNPYSEIKKNLMEITTEVKKISEIRGTDIILLEKY